MTIGKRVHTTIFTGVVIAMAVVCIMAIVGAVSWYHKPFAGFLIYKPPYVDSLGIRDWPGKKAGLTYLDRIVSVDGTPVRGGRDVVRLVEDKLPGSLVHYRVESKGATREVDVPVVLFGFRDFALVFGITFLCGVILYILGVVVFLLKPNVRSSWVFLGLCFSLGSYIATAFEIETTYRLVRFHYLALSFFPAFFLHLALIFPTRRRFLDRFPRIEYLVYVPAILLTILYQIYFGAFEQILFDGSLPWMPGYKHLGGMARIFSLFAAIVLFVFLFDTLFRDPSPVARQRARMIFFGVAVAFIPPGFAMAAVQFVKANIPWNFLVFFVVFFPATIGYSIVKHNLFDADLIIRRSMGYAVATIAVVGAYIGVSLGLNVWAGQYQLAQSRMFPILFTLGVILVFNPIHRRIQNVVDRIFFRKEYNAGEIIDRVGSAMTQLMELPQILRTLVQTFMDDMFLENSSVMLLTPDGRQYKVMLADGGRQEEIQAQVFDREAPLFKAIEEEKQEFTRYDLLENPKYESIAEGGKSKFDDLEASLMIPLLYQDEMLGTFNLGDKKSGKPFNRDDIELLRNLANQGAVAIENARLFEENLEKQRMEEELNIARDLQMSMLPAECPEIEGFQIAALTTQAKEVGGDFYDFIPMADGRLGIVIGDVTGKSVSGALVMAASRSVFRLLSENKPDVGEIMTRANRRIKNDIKTGMFVALLYAIIDAEAKTLAICSAGQTQPIYCATAKGDPAFMETEGDNFPLGILEDANYKETRIQLNARDKIVFYTDGIVEAMNADKELFGFERLDASVEKAAGLEAPGLLEAILADVKAFVGKAPQHDDITVITISVE